MTLVQLHPGLLEIDLANRFGVPQSTVLCITLTCFTTALRLSNDSHHGMWLKSTCPRFLKRSTLTQEL